MNAMNRRTFARTVTGAMIAAQGCQLKSNWPRPNILYLMTDQHRGDCLGAAGNAVINTPNLDKIARDGVLFNRAYSSTPSCTPARSGLLTGLSPWHHGMLGYGRIAQQYPFELPRAMSNAGYYTIGIGKMHFYPQKTLHGFHKTLVDESGRVETPGFVSDYRKWFKEQAPELDPDATGIGWNDYRTKSYVLPEELHPTHWTAQKAVEFIESYTGADPFMLKVSFARPHSPYDPPSRLMDMYNDYDLPKPAVGDWAKKYADVPEPFNFSLWHGNLGVEQAKRSRRGYYGSIQYIDEKIGWILKTLAKKGIMDNTLIVFCSDHGDMLGDHHLWRKTYAYEGSARIPMILRWPPSMGMNDKRGKIIETAVELRDILPTFLDAAHENIPNHLDGKSLLGFIRKDETDKDRVIDLEHDVCYSRKNHWNALTDGRIKYIYHAFDGSEQLFNLINDPYELENLSENSRYKDDLKYWRQQMVEHLSERGNPFVANNQLLIRTERMLYSPHYPAAGNKHKKAKPGPL